MIKTHSIVITPGMLLAIAEIDEFKGAWQALGALAPVRLSALRRVATIESVGSSTRIEGSALTDPEVQHLLSNLDIRTFENRDEQEVAGYAAVMDMVFASWREIAVTENHIRQLHRDLLRHSTRDQGHRGAWKTAPNTIAAFDDAGRQIGIVFETASPLETPARMTDLVVWFNRESEAGGCHPLMLIGVFVVVFLEIHPFQDGNGRLSRVLTTLLLLRAGYVYVPYTSLESVIEQSKEAYYQALRQTQGTLRSDAPDWTPWLTFFLTALQRQMRRLRAKIAREKLLRGNLSELSARLLDLVRDHGRLSIGDAERLTSENRNRLKQHFRGLVAADHLSLNGAGRGAWYSIR
jgi:Fic family protein